jgi:hypothetical protein
MEQSHVDHVSGGSKVRQNSGVRRGTQELQELQEFRVFRWVDSVAGIGESDLAVFEGTREGAPVKILEESGARWTSHGLSKGLKLGIQRLCLLNSCNF